MVRDESIAVVIPPEFAVHQTDPTTVLIEVIVPTDKPISFEDVFDVYSREVGTDGEWTKVCIKTIVHFLRSIEV